MGPRSSSQRPPGPARTWTGLILAASVLSCCLRPARPSLGLTIRQEPAAVAVGGNLTLVVRGVPPSLQVCSWYRGAESSKTSGLIVSYTPRATPRQIFGPAFTGREAVGPSCSLRITGLRATDAGSYSLNVQGPGYNQGFSASVSFAARRAAWFLAAVVGVPLVVLLCVVLLVTLAVCMKRRSGASYEAQPPGEKTGIVPK
ncbi:pregnancy-specific beta-1-glycoprotein 4-like [Pelodiscus sinensis]|uniref:pregnancy-specific beta-1-glycoprotein 4-like n=1 Tax=Pelodiscus sinensis TaxID=13735 RepID=UPI003F6D91F7